MALVLSRKEGEQIRVGDEITITITAIRGDKVRVAIDAPRDIPILRGELHAEIEQQSTNHEGESHDRDSIEYHNGNSGADAPTQAVRVADLD